MLAAAEDDVYSLPHHTFANSYKGKSLTWKSYQPPHCASGDIYDDIQG
jgi:hypothetical protein